MSLVATEQSEAPVPWFVCVPLSRTRTLIQVDTSCTVHTNQTSAYLGRFEVAGKGAPPTIYARSSDLVPEIHKAMPIFGAAFVCVDFDSKA